MPRESEWNQTLEDSVIADIESGFSLRATAERNHISKALILKKVRDLESFRDRYAHAKDIQLEAMADEILTIADSADADNYNAARLQVDSRKWLLSKLVPKKYGDKVQQELSGEIGIKTIVLAQDAKKSKPKPEIKPDFAKE